MRETIGSIAATIRSSGFAFVRAPAMRRLLEAAGLADWERFAASWDDLGMDTYMADGGRYRRRRFAAFRATAEGIVRKPHQPHYQSRDYNPLNGGIERWFEPVTEAVGAHPALIAVLATCRGLFDRLEAAPPPAWHVEIHQFRIEARAGAAGQPTPEGMHRAGVDWVLVLLVGRVNIASGETSIHDLAPRPPRRAGGDVPARIAPRAPGAKDNAVTRRTRRRREGRGGARCLRGLRVSFAAVAQAGAGRGRQRFNAKDAEEARRTRRARCLRGLCVSFAASALQDFPVAEAAGRAARRSAIFHRRRR